MRLDKFLAECGMGTRKEVRMDIKDGFVCWNGEKTTDPSVGIDEYHDMIVYKEEIVSYKGKVYYMFHKPSGCVTARKDQQHKTVLDYFHSTSQRGIFAVGRLDKDTEGLLFLTNDGEFDYNLMNPSKKVEKKYFFWALGSLNEKKKKQLETGIQLNELEITTPARIEVLQEGYYYEFESDLKQLTEYSCNNDTKKQTVVSGYITITEGRKHQIKRMLKSVGCYVIYLKRISIGGVVLDEDLKLGEYRTLSKQEIDYLMRNHYELTENSTEIET